MCSFNKCITFKLNHSDFFFFFVIHTHIDILEYVLQADIIMLYLSTLLCILNFNIGSLRTIQLFRPVPMGTTQVILSSDSCKQHLTNNQINTNNFQMFQQIKLKLPQILNKILVFRTLTRQQSDIIIPATEISLPQ